jgi:hypothetical protein
MQPETSIKTSSNGLNPYKSTLYVTLEVCKSVFKICSNKFTNDVAVRVSGASLPTRRADAE